MFPKFDYTNRIHFTFTGNCEYIMPKDGLLIFLHTGAAGGSIYIQINDMPADLLTYNNNYYGAGSSQSIIVNKGDKIRIFGTGGFHTSPIFVPVK